MPRVVVCMAILTAPAPFASAAAAQQSQLQLAQPRPIPPQQVQPRPIAPQQAQPSQPGQASPAPIHPLQASSPALAPPGRLILVLPFENHSGQANLDWVGESFPFTLNQRLSAAGFLPISRDDRMYALDHLGLPLDFKPSRATTLRIAQTLDADYVILGSFTTQNQRISAQAQVLDVHALKMSPPAQDSSQVERLLDLENAIAWKLARQMLPGYSVAEATFVAASSSVKIDAFENYIRGQVETVPSERLQHLKLAVQIAPGFAPAVLALGKTYYADQQFEKASATLASIPSSEPLSLEAGFYLGLSYFNSAHYAKAEEAFASVASRLPLPEVVNNQGVAESRQGKDAGALFTQAVSADPRDPDYRYNLAVSLRRRKDFKGALREVNESLKLKANDPEALELWQLLMKETAAAPTAPAPAPGPASGPAPAALASASSTSALPAATEPSAGAASRPPSGSAADAADSVQPLERIRRTYSEASFRQAAFELDQMRALRMSTLAPATQAAQLAQLGADYLAQGLVLEAEREFQAALAQNNNNAQAHVGLAQIREQSGDAAQARSEARTSIELKPSVAAYLVLARLDMRENQLTAAAEEVSRAMRLEPRNAAVAGMREALVAKGQQLPGTLSQ